MQLFRTRLAQLMNENSTSQYALGNAIGVARQSIAQYLDGRTQPNAEKICAIADYYGVSTDYLLGRVDFQSTDIDIQSICKKTGLSENAVGDLVEMNTQDVIYYDDDENKESEPMFADWVKRKDDVFNLINYLLSFPLLEDVIYLSEEIQERLNGQTAPLPLEGTSDRETFEELRTTAKKHGMQNIVLHPLEYDNFKKYEVDERMRIIGDRLYRLLKYGTMWAPDGKLYHNDTNAFEIAMMEAFKNGKA